MIKYKDYIILEKKTEKFEKGDYITCIKDQIDADYGRKDLNGNKVIDKHDLNLTVGKKYLVLDITPGYKSIYPYIWINNDFDDEANYTNDEDIFSMDREEIKKAKIAKKEELRKLQELKIQKEIKKLQMKDVDPYGEEEWDINENYSDLKRGEWVICIKDHMFTKYGNKHNLGLTIGKCYIVKKSSSKSIWVINDNNELMRYTVDDIFVKQDPSGNISENDPFGEENWND